MSNLNYTSLIVLLLLCNINISSQSIITDRPDQTESAFTPGKNSFQIETGSILSGSNESRELILNTTLFRYGVSEKFEIRVVEELHWDIKDQENLNNIGFSDLQLGFKYNISEQGIESGLLFHAAFPNGDRQYTGDEFAFIAKFICSGSLNDRISAGLNIGANIYESSETELSFTGVLGFSLTDKIGFFTELYGTNSKSEFFLLYDHGLTYLMHSNLQFDVSYGTGLNISNNFVSAGLSWRIQSE